MKLLQVAALFAAIVVALCVDEEVVIRGKALITPNTKQIPSYQVTGTVEISQKARGGPAFFTLKLKGFPPKTTHGFHVHATGDIHTNGCKSTGGHYNPLKTTHGGPNDETRHVGDLGNIVADEEGNVSIVIVDRMAGLVGDHSIAGRAFVVHAGVDDLGRGVGAKRAGSLKTGNAGARVACGIIYHV